MNYVLFNKTTLKVVGFGTTPETDAAEYETEEIGVLEVEQSPPPHSKVVDGLVAPMSEQEIEQDEFPAKKQDAYLQIKAIVSQGRLAYITDLPGQDAIYQSKEKEAVAYLAAANPVLTEYPLLNSETGITALTATDLANLWITMAQQWRAVAAQLEAARMIANASIGSATSVAEVEAALTNLETTIAALTV